MFATIHSEQTIQFAHQVVHQASALDKATLNRCYVAAPGGANPIFTPNNNILELANGCLCCTVQEEFLPTMQELLKRRDLHCINKSLAFSSCQVPYLGTPNTKFSDCEV